MSIEEVKIEFLLLLFGGFFSFTVPKIPVIDG